MNENEAQNLRDAIARDQRWSTCRCGHILECCADCMGWLRDHSARIEASWRWFTNKAVFGVYIAAGQRYIDAAEADDLAYFEAGR